MLALAACGQIEQPAQTDQSAAPGASKSAPESTHDPAKAHISLQGDWRVAGLDGTNFDEPVGIALKGDSGSIWWEPRCAGMARGYQVTGRTIKFRSLGPPRSPGSLTPPVCAIGLPPRLNEVFAAVDDLFKAMHSVWSSGKLVDVGSEAILPARRILTSERTVEGASTQCNSRVLLSITSKILFPPHGIHRLSTFHQQLFNMAESHPGNGSCLGVSPQLRPAARSVCRAPEAGWGRMSHHPIA